MTTYAERLAARRKAICTVYDFPAQNTRFISRKHAGVSTAGFDYVFYGASPKTDTGAKLDVDSASVTVGAASFGIPDRRKALTEWLARFDATLRLTPVTRLEGFIGVDESEYVASRWQLENVKVAETAGGYILMLANVLKAMSQSLYEDFDGESYRLDDATYGAPLASGATTIVLDKSPSGLWRQPGHALLSHREKGILELVEYQAIGGAGGKSLLTCTRRKFGVGNAAITHAPADTDIYQVWVKRGNPLDIMLEWLTTTDTPGANGSYDTGDGDGVGDRVDQDYLDVAGIEAIRDAFWPVPTFVGDAKTAGTAVLFVERDPIDDLKQWIEENILMPFGLFPVVGSGELFGVDTYFRTPPVTTIVDDEWLVRDFAQSQWERNWDSRQNNISMQTDWDAAAAKYAYQKPKTQRTSITRYGKAKPLELTGRGHRTGRRGFPDYGSSSDIDRAATRVMLALANPGTPLTIKAFYKHKGVNLGELIRINIPGVPDIATGTRGLVQSLQMVTRRKLSDDKGHIELEVRSRRAISRPAFVAPDSLVVTTYTTATESEREFCFLTPDDEPQFANGDPAYTVAP